MRRKVYELFNADFHKQLKVKNVRNVYIQDLTFEEICEISKVCSMPLNHVVFILNEHYEKLEIGY